MPLCGDIALVSILFDEDDDDDDDGEREIFTQFFRTLNSSSNFAATTVSTTPKIAIN